MLVHVGTESLRFDVDARQTAYSAQAAVVVRIRDGQGREVQRLSQQYLLSGDMKDLEAAKRGEILFYREPDLAPGIYTMESIVFDIVAQQGSARVATLTVPSPAPRALEMSSLVLVSRIEDLGEAFTPSSPVVAPLYVGRTLIYPNLGEPITRSASSELPFYFTLYGTLDGVKASAELLRNGQRLAEAPIELPPSTRSPVQHIGRFPIGALPGGTYRATHPREQRPPGDRAHGLLHHSRLTGSATSRRSVRLQPDFGFSAIGDTLLPLIRPDID